jgi:hypothetical protein
MVNGSRPSVHFWTDCSINLRVNTPIAILKYTRDQPGTSSAGLSLAPIVFATVPEGTGDKEKGRGLGEHGAVGLGQCYLRK